MVCKETLYKHSTVSKSICLVRGADAGAGGGVRLRRGVGAVYRGQPAYSATWAAAKQAITSVSGKETMLLLKRV